MTWADEDCDRPLKVSEKQAKFTKHLKERVLEEEGRRKEVEAQLDTKGAKLEGAQANLAATRSEVARLEAEDTLMEVSCLQVHAEVPKRKVAEVTEEVAAARAIALSEYQSSDKFQLVCGEQYDEGVRAFLYNVSREHPE